MGQYFQHKNTESRRMETARVMLTRIDFGVRGQKKTSTETVEVFWLKSPIN
jgi:hypothetical protein